MIVKKMTGILLTICMVVSLFIGCGRQESNLENKEDGIESKGNDIAKNIPMGRFVEENVDTPMEAACHLSTKVIDNGNLQMLSLGEDKTLQSHISSDQGLTWVKQTHIPDDFIPEGYECQTGAINKFGDIFINYGRITEKNAKRSEKEGPYKYCKITPEGEIKEFSVELRGVEPGTYGHDVSMETTEEGDLLITHTYEGIKPGIYQYKRDELTLERVIESSEASHAQLAGKNVVMIESGEVVCLDMDMKERIGTIDIDLNTYIGSKVAAGEEQEQIFLVNRKGLYHYFWETDVMEQLLDGNLTSLSNREYNIDEFIYISETEVLVVLSDYYSTPKIKRYKYNQEMPSVPVDELTIFSLYENPVIRKLILGFQKEYPDIQIVYEVGVTKETVGNLTEILKQLNTEMMAGKGPDVLFLGGLPMQSYMEKGMLADITSVVQPRLDAGELYENIIEVYRQESKLFVAPISYKIPILFGEKEDLQIVKDLEGFVTFMGSDKVKNYGIGGVINRFWPRRDIVRKLTALYGESWIKDNRIEEAALEKFLLQCNEIFQEKTAHWGDGWSDDSPGGSLTDGEKMQDEYFNDVASGIMGTFYFPMAWKETLMTLDNVGSTYALADMYNAARQREEILDYQLLETKFSPSLVAGVNEKGAEKEKAFLFIDFILSAEGQREQKLNDSYGLPVSRVVFKEECMTPPQGVLEQMGAYKDDYVWPEDAYFKRFEQIIETLDTPVLEDKILFDALDEQAQDYMYGKKELKDAVSEFKQRMDIYLAE